MGDPGAKGEDDPARQRKKLWRLDAAASGNLGARDEDNKKLWRCGAVGSGCQKTLMPGHCDVKKPWPEKAESVTKLWRPNLASSRIFDAWAPRCQRNLTPGVLRRHKTLASGFPAIQEFGHPDPGTPKELDAWGSAASQNFGAREMRAAVPPKKTPDASPDRPAKMHSRNFSAMHFPEVLP